MKKKKTYSKKKVYIEKKNLLKKKNEICFRTYLKKKKEKETVQKKPIGLFVIQKTFFKKP